MILSISFRAASSLLSGAFLLRERTQGITFIHSGVEDRFTKEERRSKVAIPNNDWVSADGAYELWYLTHRLCQQHCYASICDSSVRWVRDGTVVSKSRSAEKMLMKWGELTWLKWSRHTESRTIATDAVVSIRSSTWRRIIDGSKID